MHLHWGLCRTASPLLPPHPFQLPPYQGPPPGYFWLRFIVFTWFILAKKREGINGCGRSQTWFPWARTEESLPHCRLPQPGLTLPCLLGRHSTGEEGVEFMMMAETAHVMADQEAENIIGTRGWPLPSRALSWWLTSASWASPSKGSPAFQVALSVEGQVFKGSSKGDHFRLKP